MSASLRASVSPSPVSASSLPSAATLEEADDSGVYNNDNHDSVHVVSQATPAARSSAQPGGSGSRWAIGTLWQSAMPCWPSQAASDPTGSTDESSARDGGDGSTQHASLPWLRWLQLLYLAVCVSCGVLLCVVSASSWYTSYYIDELGAPYVQRRFLLVAVGATVCCLATLGLVLMLARPAWWKADMQSEGGNADGGSRTTKSPRARIGVHLFWCVLAGLGATLAGLAVPHFSVDNPDWLTTTYVTPRVTALFRRIAKTESEDEFYAWLSRFTTAHQCCFPVSGLPSCPWDADPNSACARVINDQLYAHMTELRWTALTAGLVLTAALCMVVIPGLAASLAAWQVKSYTEEGQAAGYALYQPDDMVVSDEEAVDEHDGNGLGLSCIGRLRKRLSTWGWYWRVECLVWLLVIVPALAVSIAVSGSWWWVKFSGTLAGYDRKRILALSLSCLALPMSLAALYAVYSRKRVPRAACSSLVFCLCVTLAVACTALYSPVDLLQEWDDLQNNWSVSSDEAKSTFQYAYQCCAMGSPGATDPTCPKVDHPLPSCLYTIMDETTSHIDGMVLAAQVVGGLVASSILVMQTVRVCLASATGKHQAGLVYASNNREMQAQL